MVLLLHQIVYFKEILHDCYILLHRPFSSTSLLMTTRPALPRTEHLLGEGPSHEILAPFTPLFLFPFKLISFIEGSDDKLLQPQLFFIETPSLGRLLAKIKELYLPMKKPPTQYSYATKELFICYGRTIYTLFF